MCGLGLEVQGLYESLVTLSAGEEERRREGEKEGGGVFVCLFLSSLVLDIYGLLTSLYFQELETLRIQFISYPRGPLWEHALMLLTCNAGNKMRNNLSLS